MSRRDRENGFTLVELLVGLAVFGLVMVAAFALYASNQQIYHRGQTKAEAQQNARVALETASREIRIAGFDMSGVLDTLTPPTSIQAANASDLTFAADLNGDGVLDRVTYRVQNRRLIREFSSWNGSAFTAPTSSELAQGIDTLTLTYFDDTTPTNVALAAPVASADLDQIRRIRLGIVASDSAVDAEESFPLFVDVRLRN
jgi:prepilin-type N-terminal cleavage/methylation domain-containing protein